MEYEVRCCCKPEKLVGWVELPEIKRPGVIRLATITGAKTALHADYYHEFASISTATTLLVITDITPPRLAIKSDDHPLEWWRQIPTFRENTQPLDK